jgi:hypothetical protein
MITWVDVVVIWGICGLFRFAYITGEALICFIMYFIFRGIIELDRFKK